MKKTSTWVAISLSIALVGLIALAVKPWVGGIICIGALFAALWTAGVYEEEERLI